MNFQDVLHFWFVELKPGQQFAKNRQLDLQIRDRFLSTYKKAMTGELYLWRSSADGRLAEIILLDQFSRNMFRDQREAFASDLQALTLAQEMVLLKLDQQIENSRRAFIYMPYMHSESAEIHQQAVKLFSQSGLEENLKYEMIHKEIIDRFGRYPHRNQILGRVSTLEELEFLKQPNSSF